MTAATYRPRITAPRARRFGVPDSTSALRTVARYPTYIAAEQAAEHLRSLGVAAEDVTILGSDLTPLASAGRLVAWRSAGRAAATGAAIGGLLGALLGLVGALPPTVAYTILSGIAIGAAVGAATGFLRHLVRGTRSEAVQLGGVRAGVYQIQVDTRHVDANLAEHRLARYWPM